MRLINATVIVMLSSVPLFAQEGDRSLITTTATGEVELAPDAAVVRIGVEAADSTPSGASGRVADALTSIHDTLATLGYPAESLPTVSFDVRPNYRSRVRDAESEGYRALITIRVTVRELDALAGVLEAVLVAGATTVGSIQYFSSNYREGRDEAATQAVEHARRDAEVLARATGGELGRLLEMKTERVPPGRFGVMPRIASAVPDTPTITPEPLVVQVAVTCTWMLAGVP